MLLPLQGATCLPGDAPTENKTSSVPRLSWAGLGWAGLGVARGCGGAVFCLFLVWPEGPGESCPPQEWETVWAQGPRLGQSLSSCHTWPRCPPRSLQTADRGPGGRNAPTHSSSLASSSPHSGSHSLKGQEGVGAGHSEPGQTARLALCLSQAGRHAQQEGRRKQA